MHPSITPVRAAVRPRTISPHSGETVPLEDAVCAWLETAGPGIVQIVGVPGSGKTAALQHLAAVIPDADQIRFLDDAEAQWPGHLWSQQRVICAANAPAATQGRESIRLRLVPWGEDEFIEYLLAVHRDCCAPVMSRLRGDPDRPMIGGLPELCRPILDRMAEDRAATARSALLYELRRWFPRVQWISGLHRYCFERLTGSPEYAERLLLEVGRRGTPVELLRLARHRYAQLLLESHRLAVLLAKNGSAQWLSRALPADLIQMTARSLDTAACKRLQQILDGNDTGQFAMAASLLFAADPAWRPAVAGQGRSFSGGLFPHASWSELDLRSARLNGADLTSADLSQSRLSQAQFAGAWMQHANLQRADLTQCDLREANLGGANLSFCRAEQARFDGAYLSQAILSGAVLCDACLRGADLEHADLTSANLHGACLASASLTGARFCGANCDSLDCPSAPLYEADFRGARFRRANLAGCDLGGMELPGADFSRANMESAVLTESRMPRAIFRGAKLRRAGLAEIDWEGADLRGADLRGGTFHLGSTRSGLVGSPIACEGSRTGFYTDDSHDQEFKAPEEIRKANLCRADLRGAQIEGVDFYLVDLRGARYTAEQEAQFRRCGAILRDRTREI